ncbi:hypothetical protein [Anaerorhabdus furcosa]|uniref:Uncharacterized protein n=1 Tax=Anaerorhabdus furcosa TaxID=118967 RepID=A0A1T4PSG4_9FIRM|nr:hypothetical protein [Anaerorhabdus furcosa]SJZ94530.1 hypothetical protein SAMN02745191_2139 [Anaerorhabdus furcosa]
MKKIISIITAITLLFCFIQKIDVYAQDDNTPGQVISSKFTEYPTYIKEETKILEEGNIFDVTIRYSVDNKAYVEIYKNGMADKITTIDINYLKIRSNVFPKISIKANGNRDVYVGTVTSVDSLGSGDQTTLALSVLAFIDLPYATAYALIGVAISIFSSSTLFYLWTKTDTYEQWTWGTTYAPSSFLGYYWMKTEARAYSNPQCTGTYAVRYGDWTSTTPGW